MGAPRLVMRGVKKRFGAVVALDGVDLEVAPGEVHALVGENGAGKSTLMKALSGALSPDAGRMQLDGADYAPRGPLDALARGVAMIYQELTLAPDLTVEQNVLLGRERSRLGIVDRAATRERVAEALAFVAHPDVTPGRRVAELGPGPRQLVEVARALTVDARVVVMDEPTSSLSRRDTERLFEVVTRLRERGVSVVYISHFLEEVQRVCDRFTLLRDGRTVGTGDVATTSIETMIERMVGRALGEIFPRVPHDPGEPLLELDALSGAVAPRDARLCLRRGEILGVAGLVGAGRTELVRAVFGLDPVTSGRVRVAGADVRRGSRGRIDAGVGMVSEDRRNEGLALGLSVADNVTLSRLSPYSRLGWLDLRARARRTAALAEELAIKCRGPAQPVGQLSGGNQQKAAIARLLHQDADVFLLDEPTRGVDVGSKVEIYRLMGELAARGKAILFVSSYVPELLGVCDRIAVMHRGALGEARAAADWTEASILDEATRGTTDSEAA